MEQQNKSQKKKQTIFVEMKERIESLERELEAISIKTKEEQENFRLRFLTKKGEINALFEEFKKVPNEKKKAFGQLINNVKQKAQLVLDSFQGEEEGDS